MVQPKEEKYSFDATLEWSFYEHDFDEIDRDVEIYVDIKNGNFVINREDNDEIKVHMNNYRFVRYKEFVTLLDEERFHYASLSFPNESVAEEIMKLVWYYKCKKSGINQFENIPPLTIEHSNHDSAAVFSYEDKNKLVQFSTSNQNESVESCKIFIDVEEEVVVVTSSKKAEPAELPFFQLSSMKSNVLIFKLDSGEKFKLYFAENKIATKVYGIIARAYEKKMAIKAEEAKLEMVLKKLNDDPNNLEKVKEHIKCYVKIFTIFEEEKYQNKIYKLYQKLCGFHEMIIASTENNTVEVSEAVESDKSAANEANKGNPSNDGKNVTAKQNKAESTEAFYYPDFVFQSDDNGIPKEKLIIFATKDGENECYEFSFDSNGYKCSKCTGESAVTAKYCMNEYGQKFILTHGKHVCEPVKYQPEKNVTDKIPLFEFLNDSNNGTERKILKNWSPYKRLHVFNPSKTALYVYERLKEEYMSTRLWCCKGCVHLNKYVYAIPRNDDKSLEILDEDHICSPETFRAPEIIKENIESEDDEDKSYDEVESSSSEFLDV